MNNTFYHGTDARIIRMTESERHSFKQDCILVIKAIWPCFGYDVLKITDTLEKLFHPDERSEHFIYDELLHTLRHVNSYLIGNGLFQYDSFYVTNDKQRAVEFAKSSFAFGEIGKFAYDFSTAWDLLIEKPFKLDEAVQKARGRINLFANDTAQPIIFEFTDLEANYLKGETGNEVDWEMVNIIPSVQCNFRYEKQIHLNINEATPVI